MVIFFICWIKGNAFLASLNAQVIRVCPLPSIIDIMGLPQNIPLSMSLCLSEIHFHQVSKTAGKKCQPPVCWNSIVWTVSVYCQWLMVIFEHLYLGSHTIFLHCHGLTRHYCTLEVSRTNQLITIIIIFPGSQLCPKWLSLLNLYDDGHGSLIEN